MTDKGTTNVNSFIRLHSDNTRSYYGESPTQRHISSSAAMLDLRQRHIQNDRFLRTRLGDYTSLVWYQCEAILQPVNVKRLCTTFKETA